MEEEFDKSLLAKTLAEGDLKLSLQGLHMLTDFMDFVFRQLTEPFLEQDAGISILHLLSRIYNDLTAISILSTEGYSVQSATISCALYEAALTVVYIDGSENLGLQWLKHKERSRGFKKVDFLKQEALNRLDWPDKKLDELRRVYTDLSMAKHSNPLILRVHSFIDVPGEDVGERHFHYGPEFTGISLRLSSYAILMSLQLGSYALVTYLNSIADLLDDRQRNEAKDRYDNFAGILQEIIQAAAEKYKDSGSRS